MGYLKTVLLTSVVSFAGLTFFCTSNNPTSPKPAPGSGSLETADPVVVGTQTIPPSGGTFAITNSSSAINGLTITVPANAFSGSRDFQVSTSEIKSYNFGADFHPVTPVVTIDAGTGYADSAVIITIPAKIPGGGFAMGFIYDAASGSLEGLPIVAEDSASITVATRTFTTPSAQPALGKASSLSTTALSILVSVIDTVVLFSKGTIASGFLPQVDDWEFVNAGSYIADGGMCAGQSMTAMWYYSEKKLKDHLPPLYHAYDKLNNPADKWFMWQDNPRGIRFASSVQNDIVWTGKLRQVFSTIARNPNFQNLSWKAFAYSILLTNQPQYIGLRSDSGGHAIIAYKADMASKLLYVADPNYPGQVRTITYNAAAVKFDPYSSKENANEADESPYWGIGYYAKTSMVDWDKIGARWAQFLNGTIGNDRFPKYTLWVYDGSGYALGDTLITDADTLIVSCISAACATCYAGTNGLQNLSIYDSNGTLLTTTTASGLDTLYLSPGTTVYGFAMSGGTPHATWSFLDFRWITIVNSTLSINPVNMNGTTDSTYLFTASSGSLPAQAVYQWVVTDSLNTVVDSGTKTNVNTFSVHFPKAGTFTVCVNLYDTDTTKIVGRAKTFAIMSNGTSGVDPQLIGTWIPWSLLTQDYMPTTSWQDTVVVTTTKFLEGSVYASPGISSCKLIANNGNIGSDCGSAQYEYDYTVDGDMLYMVLEYTSATQTVTDSTSGVLAFKKKQ